MTCYHPVPTWRSKQVNASGKRSLVFSESKGIDGTRMEIPCGGCIGCRLDRAAEWQTRLLHESKEHRVNCFLTCTYSNDNLPPHNSLNKKDFQDFMKRLRKHVSPLKIRFFACGEYGDQTERPHYHAIIFGYDFSDKKKHSKGSRGDQIYVSDTLGKLWGLGHCWIGSVTPESCGYVARYIMKKVRGEQAELHYTRPDPQTGELISITPEYIHMSLKPAIGATFYDKFAKEIHGQDSVLIKGSKRKVPRYYDKKLDAQNPERLEELKFLRAEKAKSRAADSTDDRLAVREQFKIERTKGLQRKFL